MNTHPQVASEGVVVALSLTNLGDEGVHDDGDAPLGVGVVVGAVGRDEAPQLHDTLADARRQLLLGVRVICSCTCGVRGFLRGFGRRHLPCTVCVFQIAHSHKCCWKGKTTKVLVVEEGWGGNGIISCRRQEKQHGGPRDA